MDAMIDAYVYEGLIQLLDLAPLNYFGVLISFGTEFHFWLDLFDKDLESRRNHSILLLLKRLLHKAWLQ